MNNDTPLIQFYLKCQHIGTGKTITYRFAHQDELLEFSKKLTEKQLAIIDTHIAFYDIDLLFNTFDNDVSAINASDINTAISYKL